MDRARSRLFGEGKSLSSLERVFEGLGDLLPEQFFAQRRSPLANIRGERKLMFAVLVEGVRNFLGDVHGNDAWSLKLREQDRAQEWILDDSEEGRFGWSFRQLCGEFGIEAGILRSGLIQARSDGLNLGKIRDTGARCDTQIKAARREISSAAA